MFTFISKEQAREEGMTHQGRLYGLLPCYIRFVDDEEMEVCFKWSGFEHIEPALSSVWLFIWEMTKDEPPEFGVLVTGEL